ncbi:MAG: tetratricopeptide repeat protein [Muribaculaceae bacterium]
MAKNEKSTRTSIEEINESLSSIEQNVEKNKKMILWVVIGIVVVAAVVLGYIYGVRNPNIEKAKAEISLADMQAAQGNDSIALAQYKAVSDKYSCEPANRAALEAGIRLYTAGKYQEALNYLQKYDITEAMVGAASQSLIGDCYVNLKKYDDAIKYFEKAISLSESNPLYTPLFMMKEATVYRELKNYKAEAELYKTIDSKYPEFAASYQTDIKKYLERAEAQAGE